MSLYSAASLFADRRAWQRHSGFRFTHAAVTGRRHNARQFDSDPHLSTLHCRMCSLHPSGRIRAGRRRRRNHQAKSLQQHYRALRRCPPDELATFSLAILHVDVAARIFEAAILKRAVDENPLIQDQVLVLENLVFVSSHEKTRLPPPGRGRKLRVDAHMALCGPTEILRTDCRRVVRQSRQIRPLSGGHADWTYHLYLDFPRCS